MRFNRVIFVLVLLLVVAGSVLPVQAQDDNSVPPFLREHNPEGPFKFTNINVRDRTETTAVLVWETTHPARARLRIRSKLGHKQVMSQLNFRRKHSMKLDDLREGTNYGFRVRSRNRADSRIQSQVLFFRTKGTPPPRIKNVFVKRRTRRGGQIHWTTNIPTRADFAVDYDTRFRFETKHETPTRHHSVTVTAFSPDDELTYRIVAEDTRGRTDRVGPKTFRTRENNVAWNQAVRGTFDQPRDHGPTEGETDARVLLSRVTDGDFSYDGGMATSGDPADTDQWLQIDMTNVYRPDTIAIYWRFSAYPEQYSLYGSTFGEYWVPLAENLDASDGQKVTAPGGGSTAQRQVITDFPEVKDPIRFIRLSIPKGSPYYTKYDDYDYVQLLEIKVFPREKQRPENEGRIPFNDD